MFNKGNVFLGSTTGGWATRTLTEHDLKHDPSIKLSGQSLAVKYGVPFRTIVERNGGRWGDPATNNWIKSVGGREVTPGNWALTVGNRISLPVNPVIPHPPSAGPSFPITVPGSEVLGADVGGGGWWLLGGASALSLFFLLKARKKQKRKPAPKPVRF